MNALDTAFQKQDMNTDPIPEAREGARSVRQHFIFTGSFEFASDDYVQFISEACLAYHKRRLTECGGDVNEFAHSLWGGRNIGDEAYFVERVLTHTAKAVDEAVDSVKNEKIRLLTKQCEELRIRAEKAEAELTAIRLAVDDGTVALQDKLSQLQQDVKPLLKELRNHSTGGSETLETFLSKHPELKETK